MTDAAPLTIRLHKHDNVVVARLDTLAGTEVPGEGVRCAARIPAGHKIATASIEVGAPVRKYDQIIGFASEAIAPGDHVHTHNVEMHAFERDYAVGAGARPTALVPEAERASFEGFVIEQVLAELAQTHPGAEASFFRTSDGHEVDLVLAIDQQLWAIEVKLTTSPSLQDMQRLARTGALFGATRCLLVSRTREVVVGAEAVSCDLGWLLEELGRTG